MRTCYANCLKNFHASFRSEIYPGNVGSFGVLIRTWVQGAVCTRNAALKVGCSWLSACIVELGYLVKVPPPSQRSACVYIDARTRIARTHSTRTYTCVYGHEVRYCQIAWHVVSMYSIVSSVTACEITWLRSDGYDPTYLCSRPSKQSSYELLYRKETLVPRAIHSRALNFYKNSN